MSIRVELPVNPDTFCLLNEPTSSRSGSPPLSKQDFSSPFNNASVKTLCVPSVTEPLELEPPEP